MKDFYIGQRVRVGWGFCGPQGEIGREGQHVGTIANWHLVLLDGDEDPTNFKGYELETVGFNDAYIQETV